MPTCMLLSTANLHAAGDAPIGLLLRLSTRRAGSPSSPQPPHCGGRPPVSWLSCEVKERKNAGKRLGGLMGASCVVSKEGPPRAGCPAGCACGGGAGRVWCGQGREHVLLAGRCGHGGEHLRWRLPALLFVLPSGRIRSDRCHSSPHILLTGHPGTVFGCHHTPAVSRMWSRNIHLQVELLQLRQCSSLRPLGRQRACKNEREKNDALGHGLGQWTGRDSRGPGAFRYQALPRACIRAEEGRCCLAQQVNSSDIQTVSMHRDVWYTCWYTRCPRPHGAAAMRLSRRAHHCMVHPGRTAPHGLLLVSGCHPHLSICCPAG